MKTQQIDSLFADIEEQALADLARLVNTNSFTGNVEGLKAAGDVINEIAASNGLKLEKAPASGEVQGAAHLVADFADGGQFYGLVGHFDTVHPPDSPFNSFADEGKNLTGPGVQDMKSGIVSAIYALRLIRELTGLDALPVKIVFNCDEETGSQDSRRVIEDMMRGAKGAFIFEGRNESDNALVTSRKGIIMGGMTVTGKAAHAGESPRSGASAIVEAAHKITALDALTDLDNGLVVTTGKISGGEVANQIPARCESTIDIRFPDDKSEAAVKEAVKSIMDKTHVQGCSTEFTLNTARPAFVKTGEAGKLLDLYKEAAAAFDSQVSEKSGGGGSDGNLTAALGVPTIDGIGPSGGHPHTHDEYIDKASFFRAIKTFALFFANLLESKKEEL